MDLQAIAIDIQQEQVHYRTGLAVEIPEGYVGLIFPRSSVRNKNLSLSNSVGVIDSGYRGEIMATFNWRGMDKNHYQVGDRIMQLMIIPYPQVEFEETDTLSDTERSVGGFGSTGN
jgi:dUTP pyrophosphatase